MKKQLAFIVVGAGGMGSTHAKGFQKQGCKLISIVDLDARRAETLASACDALDWSTDYADEVQRSGANFVVIATWPDSHASLAITALQAGKHVFCEKPIAHTLAAARSMIDAARQSKGKLFIGHCLRYEEPWLTVVPELQRSVIGKPLVMRMAGNQMTFGSVWQTQRNLIKVTSPLIDCGVHYVDLMRWIVQARAVEVVAMGARLADDIPNDKYNYGLLQVKFADGSIGHYEAGWGPMMTKNSWYIKDFAGPRGSYSVLYDLDQDLPDQRPTRARYTLRLQQFDHPDAEWKDIRINERIIEKDVNKQNITEGEHRFFLETIQNESDGAFLVEDAYKALEIVLAADRSIRTGMSVSLR